MTRQNNFLGAVIIGRNEGERLRRCIASVLPVAQHVVYVDSGSTDGSAQLARDMGVCVVDLNLRIPFTAARARNEGFLRLNELSPDLSYVQFVDGDCELISGWIATATDFLDTHTNVAVVCGRRRERYPERSVYNRLCDMEWDTPIGEAKACGGDALMRSAAFRSVGGYRADLIAGEEPELCVRLRAQGHRVWRLDTEMVWHDAGMLRFGQWWRRSMRAGHAFAEGAFLHRAPPERHWVREVISAVLWGVLLPLVTFAGCATAGPISVILLTAYPLQVVRIAQRGRRSWQDNWLLAVFLVGGKFPEALGAAKFWFSRMVGKRSHLIEYK